MKLWTAVALMLLTQPAAAQSPHDRGLPTDPVSVYMRLCSFCHDDGQIGAPIIGDKGAWAPYLKKSREQMYRDVLEGGNHMPGRRGRRGYTDEEIKRATDFLLSGVTD